MRRVILVGLVPRSSHSSRRSVWVASKTRFSCVRCCVSYTTLTSMSSSLAVPHRRHHCSCVSCRCPRLAVECARAAAPRAASQGSRSSLRAGGIRSAALASPTTDAALRRRTSWWSSTARTFPLSSIVNCPTSCPRLSPVNMRSPCSSIRKSSEELSWARAGGSMLA